MFLCRQQDAWDPFRVLASCRTGSDLLESGTWLPDVDIVEEKDRILARVDLPGMKQQEIRVEVVDDVLSIRGQRQREFKEEREGQVYRIERSYGTFARDFRLPSTVDASKVTASYKDGVLEVTLPKREQAQPKQINVSVN